jgi:hypothetical protein
MVGLTNKWTLHKMNIKWDVASLHLLVCLMFGVVQMTELNLCCSMVTVKSQGMDNQYLSSKFCFFFTLSVLQIQKGIYLFGLATSLRVYQRSNL